MTTLRRALDVAETGSNVIGEVPAARWDLAELPKLEESVRTRCRFGGFVQNAEFFDKGVFRLTAAEANAVDPQQRLVLEV
eukprot:485218-Prymnesium_polylepis.1